MKQCPKCNAQVKDTAKFCGKCGCNILQYEAEHEERFCTACGAKASPDDFFCPECGRKLDDEQEAETFASSEDAEIDEINALAAERLAEKKAQDQAERDAKAAYDGKITRARALSIRGKYEEAKEIYESLIDENPVDMNGYMGMIRVSSKNYAVFEGEEIENDIRIAKQISRKEDLSEYDPDYADYAARRKKYFADKAAEAERKAKEEAEHKAKEETAKNSDIQNGVLIKYKGKGGDVLIPDSVRCIGAHAFQKCSSLTSVTIGDSVTSIGNGAFQSCSNLTSVTIGDSVTSIGGYAFSGCSNLKSVTIGDSVTSIGYRAFQSCRSLTVINVDENNINFKSIDGNLYSKDGTTLIQYAIGKKDTAFTIPDSVKSIGNGAFCECSNLTSVTIPNSVTSIKDYVFQECSNLTSVTIPNSVTSIGDCAFYGCSNLTSVTIPRNCSVGNNAFPQGCKINRR